MIRGGVRGLAILMLAGFCLPAHADAPYPPVVARAIDHAAAAGDAQALGVIAGGNPMYAAEIVAVAVTRRPELAARIAASAAQSAPQVAPQIAAAAAVAAPKAATDIVIAVTVAVPAAGPKAADAVLGALPPGERVAQGVRIRDAVAAHPMPSIEDPQPPRQP